MEKLTETSCRAFAEALASKAPIPGGGGASALVGSLGVSLCSMVSRYTLGKPKYAAVEADIRAILEEAERLRERFLELVDEDAAAFAPLSRAYGIPKDDPSRETVMEQCLRNAAAPPMEMLRLSCRVIELHQSLLEKGSVMVLSDVGTGVIFAWSALYGAWLNVKVNTKSMTDRTYADGMNQEADALVEKYWKIAEGVYQAVMGRYS